MANSKDKRSENAFSCAFANKLRRVNGGGVFGLSVTARTRNISAQFDIRRRKRVTLASASSDGKKTWVLLAKHIDAATKVVRQSPERASKGRC